MIHIFFSLMKQSLGLGVWLGMRPTVQTGSCALYVVPPQRWGRPIDSCL